jgi:hypothetical protein
MVQGEFCLKSSPVLFKIWKLVWRPVNLTTAEIKQKQRTNFCQYSKQHSVFSFLEQYFFAEIERTSYRVTVRLFAHEDEERSVEGRLLGLDGRVELSQKDFRTFAIRTNQRIRIRKFRRLEPCRTASKFTMNLNNLEYFLLVSSLPKV